MDLQNLCKKVRDVAKEAAVFISEEAQNFSPESIQYKDYNNILTYVDTETEKQLVFGLRQLLPEAGFIAEEGTASEMTGDYMWYIDPLDGTTNFSHGLPIYAISIGLTYKGQIILGVVYHINKKESYYAWKDGGAYCNGQRLQVSTNNALDKSLLATGFPYYKFDELDDYMDILKDFMQKSHGLRRMGSAAIDLCYVARGRFDGFFEFNLMPWDVNAGTIIVQEAGGTVTTFDGGDDVLSGKEIVAAGPIHAEMLDVIKSKWKK